ncbi:ankyrin repeat domain-containing protein [Phytohabitans rumicis]|nr:ankyrin repeat domain-containing protein [Phytohabitans rumicis]
MSAAHEAVESGDLETLARLLRTGEANIHEEFDGLTLLHHAIDVELDTHTQTGGPLHVDTTALLLALGADPRRGSAGGVGPTAEHVAFVNGHWLASCLFEGWGRGGG